MTYAFCETQWASDISLWHIRQLTDKGFMCGGGADTLALCSREVAWDLNIEVTGFNRVLDHPGDCCTECVKRYREAAKEKRNAEETAS